MTPAIWNVNEGAPLSHTKEKKNILVGMMEERGFRKWVSNGPAGKKEKKKNKFPPKKVLKKVGPPPTDKSAGWPWGSRSSLRAACLVCEERKERDAHPYN